MLEPGAMLGSVLGSVLYNWMPQSASVLLLVSVLGGISTRMLSVDMHEWQKASNPYVELESVEISPAAGVAAYRSMTEFSDAVHVTRPVGVVIPWRIISILLVLFCGCTVINALHLLALRHDAGPALRGLFSPLLTLFVLFVGLRLRLIVLQEWEQCEQDGSARFDDEIAWSWPNRTLFPALFVAVGLIAGLTGMGGLRYAVVPLDL